MASEKGKNATVSKNNTIYDIAEALHITPSTVSRALNNHPRISKKTKEDVMIMAKKLNYRQNSLASALSKGQSHIIGVIMPRINRSFFASLVRGIESELSAKGYHVIIAQSHDKRETEERNINALMKVQVDGIIASLAGGSESYEHFNTIIEQETPLVLCDRVSRDIAASTVVIDDYQGAYEATSHLIKNGYRKIAHLTGSDSLNIYKYRKLGYMAALRTHNLEVDPELIIATDMQVSGGENAMRYLRDLNTKIDAIFSSSDYSALGVMNYCKKVNIKIPNDFGVVGFSNENFTEFVHPTLSSVEQKSVEIGATAARLMLEKMRQKKHLTENTHVVINPKLIVRKSSSID